MPPPKEEVALPPTFKTPAMVVEPVLEIWKSVVVAEAVELAMMKALLPVLVSPLLRESASLAHGVVVPPRPILPLEERKMEEVAVRS